MISKITLENFGPLTYLNWRSLGKINLVLGKNSAGKTFLLKAIYSAMRTIEEYKRGDELKSASEILADKLYWTFQAGKIGELVTKGANGNLSFEMEFDGNIFNFKFGKDTTKQIASLENHISSRSSNSIFLPAKEVLSLHQIILKSREQDKSFGFDDTYLDLARALRQSPQRGKNYKEFSDSRKRLEDMFGGKVEHDDSGRWQFKRNNQKFPIGVTAEGIKKIAILDTLLSNRYLDTDSIVFIDEPESALHPTAISELFEIIALLADRGIQFFLATHSYFVVKKLYLLAQKNKSSIPVISSSENGWNASDLLKGMPDNPIIDESIRLYKEEVELALK